MEGGNGKPPVVVTASPLFSRILVGLFIITLILLGLWVGLAVGINDPDTAQSNLIEGISKAFTGCLGALFGLIGGKLA